MRSLNLRRNRRMKTGNREVEPADEDSTSLRQPLAGDSLRDKRNPSVAELIAQRSDAMDNAGHLRFIGIGASDPEFSMTTCLAKWDAKAAGPSIRRRFAEWHKEIRTTDGKALTGTIA